MNYDEELGKAIHLAARALPIGWTIHLVIERGGYDLALTGDDGVHYRSINGGGAAVEVDELINVAISIDKVDIINES